jgi:hypothetical protein
MARERKFASSDGAKETPAGKLMEAIVEDVPTVPRGEGLGLVVEGACDSEL